MERVLALAERAVRAYTEDERLYRPVLRAVTGEADAGASPPLLETCTELWRAALRDTEAARLLDRSLDVELLARQLHLEYRAGMSLWLSGETDDRGWRLQLLHGVLLGAGAEPPRPRLRRRLRAVQREIASGGPKRAESRAGAGRAARRKR